jgi:hypothetical protein
MLSIARAKMSCELGKIRHQAYYHPLLSWTTIWVKVSLIQVQSAVRYSYIGEHRGELANSDRNNRAAKEKAGISPPFYFTKHRYRWNYLVSSATKRFFSWMRLALPVRLRK